MSKHKPALPERLYYRLADAANYLGCSTDDLLHLGVCGYLEILASVDFQIAVGSVFDQSRAESIFATEQFVSFDFFAFSRIGLKEMERTGEARASGARNLYLSVGSKLRKAVPTSGGKVTLREETHDSQFPGDYFSWVFLDGAEKSTIGDSVYFDEEGSHLKELKITPENLWVRTKELRRFEKEGSSHVLDEPELPPDNKKPHGNAENNARNREAVLKAAIAVKANFPDLCKTNRDWAKAIDEKARLFWPEGEPPLKLDTIERLIGESLKLPDGE